MSQTITAARALALFEGKLAYDNKALAALQAPAELSMIDKVAAAFSRLPAGSVPEVVLQSAQAEQKVQRLARETAVLVLQSQASAITASIKGIKRLIAEDGPDAEVAIGVDPFTNHIHETSYAELLSVEALTEAMADADAKMALVKAANEARLAERNEDRFDGQSTPAYLQ